MSVSINAVHYRILDAVKAAIEGANLTGLPRVVIEKDFASLQAYNANTIYVTRAPELPAGGTMGADAIGFPAVMFMCKGTGGAPRENEAALSEWRWDLHSLFADKRAPIANLGLEKVTPLICRFDFGSDLLDDFWKKRWDVSHAVAVAYIRKIRS